MPLPKAFASGAGAGPTVTNHGRTADAGPCLARPCGARVPDEDVRESWEERAGRGGTREGWARDPEPRSQLSIFATRALTAGEEIVAGWEWDDGNAVHRGGRGRCGPPHRLHAHARPTPPRRPARKHPPRARLRRLRLRRLQGFRRRRRRRQRLRHPRDGARRLPAAAASTADVRPFAMDLDADGDVNIEGEGDGWRCPSRVPHLPTSTAPYGPTSTAHLHSTTSSSRGSSAPRRLAGPGVPPPNPEAPAATSAYISSYASSYPHASTSAFVHPGVHPQPRAQQWGPLTGAGWTCVGGGRWMRMWALADPTCTARTRGKRSGTGRERGRGRSRKPWWSARADGCDPFISRGAGGWGSGRYRWGWGWGDGCAQDGKGERREREPKMRERCNGRVNGKRRDKAMEVEGEGELDRTGKGKAGMELGHSLPMSRPNGMLSRLRAVPREVAMDVDVAPTGNGQVSAQTDEATQVERLAPAAGVGVGALRGYLAQHELRAPQPRVAAPARESRALCGSLWGWERAWAWTCWCGGRGSVSSVDEYDYEEPARRGGGGGGAYANTAANAAVYARAGYTATTTSEYDDEYDSELEEEEEEELRDELMDMEDDVALAAALQTNLREMALGDWARGRILDGAWVAPAADVYYGMKAARQHVNAVHPVPWAVSAPSSPSAPTSDAAAQHPRTSAPPPPMYALAGAAHNAYLRQLRVVLLPVFRNVVRRLVVSHRNGKTENTHHSDRLEAVRRQMRNRHEDVRNRAQKSRPVEHTLDRDPRLAHWRCTIWEPAMAVAQVAQGGLG
ncbi:hypothetical protein DFH09DRAFT_1113066 [Mycena vulgaris]|nr:hypothetical protein DFH09DRAFT_1113066 [Mycena vulgaris]